MKQSELFGDVMHILWNDVPEKGNSTEAVAVASYIRNHRVNAENAFEALRIMWPTCRMSIRTPGEGVPDTKDDGEGEAWYDVSFPDGSLCLVMSTRGICCMIEEVG